MKSSIITKLKKHLADDFDKESDIVYLFIEIGKFLEQTSNINYKLIKFYRNWIAHSRINRIEAISDLSLQIEFLINEVVAKQQLDVVEKCSRDISKLLAFPHLFAELQRFFQENELPGDLIETFDRKIKFGKLLIGVLADVPLIFSPDKFKHLRTISFTEIYMKGNIKESLATWYIKTPSYRIQGPVIFDEE